MIFSSRDLILYLMSLIEKVRETVIPLERILSPWDDQRWLLRTPTPEEILAAPEELLFYREHWDEFLPEFPDQGNRGTCVGWAHTGDSEVNNKWRDNIMDDLSPEDCYYKARKYDGLPDIIGEGSNNLGAMKARQKEGICLEATYPTSIDKAVPSPGIQKPLEEYREEAAQYVIDNYYQVQLMPSVWKTSIAGIISDPQWDGPKPIVAAYKCTGTMFEYAEEHDGILPSDPGADVLGGHSSLFAAYKIIDGELYFGNANTWGADQGDEGWFWHPSSYLFNGIILEGMISHYGPPIIPEEPSGCIVAQSYARLGNGLSSVLGRKSRFKTYIPKY